jgi:hypothetical protein
MSGTNFMLGVILGAQLFTIWILGRIIEALKKDAIYYREADK